MSQGERQSAVAFEGLLEVLREAHERCLSPEWGVAEGQRPDALRRLVHVLEAALLAHFEADPERPVFRRIVSPTRKFEGDNPDAVYFEATIHPKGTYRVRGNLAGAVYTSFTLEAGTSDGRYSGHTSHAIHDAQMVVGADGSYELVLGGPRRANNWLPLGDDTWRVMSRHYFEDEVPRAADPNLRIPLEIENLEAPPPPPRPDDASVARGLTRARNYVAGMTLDRPPAPPERMPDFVGFEPNVFPKPVPPGTLGFSAPDSAYSMAPFRLAPDEALVMEGRFPACRFANVVLFNESTQTLDYAHRRVSLNRATTRLEADGSFRMVIAHRDPGLPNWLDTEGRESGHVFWRFFLPEGPIETPRGRVVPFAELAGTR